ncbi:hypothetical protein EVAR_93923_1 [Eumeta japonica]|uniref:Uncharacterized protein n=1 Tax=Eumeta variegata TaxID=151549 RepID=A0A4C1TP44_EUMVA|nr:hypothetical protein EVAR_93923_1 [Eumeta japonica]
MTVVNNDHVRDRRLNVSSEARNERLNSVLAEKILVVPAVAKFSPCERDGEGGEKPLMGRPCARAHRCVRLAQTKNLLNNVNLQWREQNAITPSFKKRPYGMEMPSARNNGNKIGVYIKDKRISCHSFVSLYDVPYSTNVVFGRRHRRTSLTQIVSQIRATTFEFVKPVINSDKGWSVS